MDYNAGKYDVVVIGAGHAGCEAALASARLGKKTVMLTLNLDSIALMACNPSIGGTSKGHLVREIDALGGEMGKAADATFIQIKMLNTSRGEAVKSLRAQIDKRAYHERMKRTLEQTDNMEIRQAEAVEIMVKNGKLAGIKTSLDAVIECGCAVLSTGVYLKSRTITGEHTFESGPSGLHGANYLSASLKNLGFSLYRFKTGTPARVDGRSLDFSKMEIQEGDDSGLAFSFSSGRVFRQQVPCYLTYTNENTHEIIRKNISRSPLYSGVIEGIGPRYCPSIEDKVVKFPGKNRHQLFLEPEALSTSEMYVQGMSSSLPEEVQVALYRTVAGMENVKFTRTAYAIEYDAIDARVLKNTLESKDIAGLFFAGQVNGTSGYEEAAAQGLVAGVNAAMLIDGCEPLALTRANSYIGVLIDDLITKGTNEPYRMMTARAEYRLNLRQDNADLRLTQLGRRTGLVGDERFAAFEKRAEQIHQAKELFESISLSQVQAAEIVDISTGVRALELIKRPQVSYADILRAAHIESDIPADAMEEAQTQIKYEGYLLKQQRLIDKFNAMENRVVPDDIDYLSIEGLRLEARQKLNKVRPQSVGQAQRISGVSPADISVLLIYLAKERK